MQNTLLQGLRFKHTLIVCINLRLFQNEKKFNLDMWTSRKLWSINKRKKAKRNSLKDDSAIWIRRQELYNDHYKYVKENRGKDGNFQQKKGTGEINQIKSF